MSKGISMKSYDNKRRDIHKIKKDYRTLIPSFALSFLLFVFFLSVPISAEAASPGYTIEDYHIEMVVREENAFEITERITANFHIPKHGIYRKIPLHNIITRTDGTTSKNRAQITDLSVSEDYTVSRKEGCKVIKIGSPDTTLTGIHTYTIKYTYDIGKDPLKDGDELYFNLIGKRWDTTINHVTFTITMPKEFDQSLLGFLSGSSDSEDSLNVSYTVKGNTISGSLEKELSEGQALTVRLSLPEGYFAGAGFYIDLYAVLVSLFSFLCIPLAAGLWMKYGKADKAVKTVECYPPKECNPAEAQLIYSGQADTNGIISLLIYLAEKGCLKIEETAEKGFLKKRKGFQITKLKEYDGNNQYERLFFDGLFSCAENGGKERTVTNSDLENKFYKTLNGIREKLNSRESRNQIFEEASIRKRRWLIGMMAAIYILITAKPVLSYREAASLPFIIFGTGFGFALMIGTFIRAIKAPELFGLIFGGAHSGICWAYIMLPILSQDSIYMAMYMTGIICIMAIVPFARNMPKRTPYGSEMFRKLRGFQRFLKTAKKPQLESLAEQNPEYFYHILPYAYALGISRVWTKRFETIILQTPAWYDGYGSFHRNRFHHFMTSTMPKVQTTMSSGRRGASGSGGAGGGSGGGGGGAW